MDEPVIVNNPGSSNSGGNGMGFLLGVVILIVFVVFLLYYGLPMIQRSFSGPQITVPDKIDVNVNQGE